MTQKNDLYHVYASKPFTSVLAHSLTLDQLCERIAKKDFDFELIEILKVSQEKYTMEASY